ncbi:MAG: hypothetical protein U0793_11275 [Gemmataceae bacterium]
MANANETSPAKLCYSCHEDPQTGKGPDGIYCRFCNLADEALEAFWEVIVHHFPEARSGDLSPMATVRLSRAAQVAVKEWISNNVPTS